MRMRRGVALFKQDRIIRQFLCTDAVHDALYVAKAAVGADHAHTEPARQPREHLQGESDDVRRAGEAEPTGRLPAGRTRRETAGESITWPQPKACHQLSLLQHD